MSRRLRRLPAALLPVVLLAGLTACGGGDDDSSSSSSAALDSVSISGDVGKEPQVNWKSQMTVDSVSSSTLTTGDGAKLADGDVVNAMVWIGDGYTKQQASSGFDRAPEQVPIDSNGNPAIIDALKGQTIGSRVAITAPADKIFGASGNAAARTSPTRTRCSHHRPRQRGRQAARRARGQGPAGPLVGPEGGREERRGHLPGLQQGPEARRQAPRRHPHPGHRRHGEEGPDTSRSTTSARCTARRRPSTRATARARRLRPRIGAGQVIPGWDKTIVGKKVGSRVLLAIPPKEGYGTQGSPRPGSRAPTRSTSSSTSSRPTDPRAGRAGRPR